MLYDLGTYDDIASQSPLGSSIGESGQWRELPMTIAISDHRH